MMHFLPSLNFHLFEYCYFLIRISYFIPHKTMGVTYRRKEEGRKQVSPMKWRLETAGETDAEG